MCNGSNGTASRRVSSLTPLSDPTEGAVLSGYAFPDGYRSTRTVRSARSAISRTRLVMSAR